jgi:hypothetical protein
MAALFLLMPRLLRRIPARLINIPNREYWLAPERRDEAMARIGATMSWFAVGIVALLVATLELVVRANLRRRNLDHVAMLVLLGAFALFLIVWLVVLWRQFRRPRG